MPYTSPYHKFKPIMCYQKMKHRLIMFGPIIKKTVNVAQLHMSACDWLEKAKHCQIGKLRKNSSCLF